jgi:hypothetical protein
MNRGLHCESCLKLPEIAKPLRKKKPSLGFSCTPRRGETVRGDRSNSAQSLLSSLPKKKSCRKVTTFSHTIAGNSPCGADGMANRKRPDRKPRRANFSAKFSADTLLSATYGHDGGWSLKTVPRVRILSAPPRSLKCSEFSPSIALTCAKHARISQYLVREPDCDN